MAASAVLFLVILLAARTAAEWHADLSQEKAKAAAEMTYTK